ncbi:hypothetical protein WR25_21798 [Diploscapter pachys]|uniref:Beta-sarcoglycan n=1 Tax=Diploscapter pachys TaxID=2018661 RepID=A0A2A2L7R7_9BILA|nr:hypothetical protein WR25_21798 [Diploscapter pachys]
MPHRAYVRSTSTDESVTGLAPEKQLQAEEADIAVTGLREKKLIALVICLALLSLLALFILIVNILLITTLKMNHHGMRFLRFQEFTNKKTSETEKIVTFSGSYVDFDMMEVNRSVIGYPNQDMKIEGSRVIITGERNGTQLVVQDGICRFDNAHQFMIVNAETKRPMFSAQHPMLKIGKKIKKLATGKIITNKIRAPVDQNLDIKVNDVSIRGNEGIRLEASNNQIAATTRIVFNTSRDGSITLSGRLQLGSSTISLPLSPSPALSASIDAFRLCACGTGKPRFFLVPGNRPCMAMATLCS